MAAKQWKVTNECCQEETREREIAERKKKSAYAGS